MRKYFSGIMSLALVAVLFTGCGCTNSNMEPTTLPTNQATTHMTTAPTTRATTAPTAAPTTEATMLPTETASTDGTVTGTEATGNSRSANRAPAVNE